MKRRPDRNHSRARDCELDRRDDDALARRSSMAELISDRFLSLDR